jgi:hypothetical protein
MDLPVQGTANGPASVILLISATRKARDFDNGFEGKMESYPRTCLCKNNHNRIVKYQHQRSQLTTDSHLQKNQSNPQNACIQS